MKESFYIITYDESEEFDYSEMKNEIKKAKKWWNYLEYSWLIITNETSEEIWYRLEPYVNRKTSLLIAKLDENDMQGWLTRDAWDWIKENRNDMY